MPNGIDVSLSFKHLVKIMTDGIFFNHYLCLLVLDIQSFFLIQQIVPKNRSFPRFHSLPEAVHLNRDTIDKYQIWNMHSVVTRICSIPSLPYNNTTILTEQYYESEKWIIQADNRY